MAWIAIHQQLSNHRKVRDLFRKLKISRQEAIGILVLIWLWGIDNTNRTCLILSATKEDIAEAAYWKGDAETLYVALVESGWIDEKDGKMYFHDWDEFNKPYFDYIDRKEKDKQRKRDKNSAGNSEEIPLENLQEFHESQYNTIPLINNDIDIINNNARAKEEKAEWGSGSRVYLTLDERSRLGEKFKTFRVNHLIILLSKMKIEEGFQCEDDFKQLLKMGEEEYGSK